MGCGAFIFLMRSGNKFVGGSASFDATQSANGMAEFSFLLGDYFTITGTRAPIPGTVGEAQRLAGTAVPTDVAAETNQRNQAFLTAADASITNTTTRPQTCPPRGFPEAVRVQPAQ